MKNPLQSGNIALVSILARLVKQGKKVLIPFDSSSRYDLAIDNDGQLIRLQVKAGWLDRDGTIIRFNVCSNNKGYKRKAYQGEIEFFAVYCEPLDKIYFVPVDDTVTEIWLRLKPTANGQKQGIRWAKDYEYTGE